MAEDLSFSCRRAHGHVCLIFGNEAEVVARCEPLMRNAGADERWIFVSNGDAAPGSGAIARQLAGVSVVDAASLQMREPTVAVESVLQSLRALIDATMQNGDRRLTLLLDMSWLLHAPSGIAHAGDFEALLQQLVDEKKVRAVCLYNRHLFPETLLLDVLCTHPFVWDSRGEFRNPHFLPPRVYLSGDTHGKLDSWLSSLAPLAATPGYEGDEPDDDSSASASDERNDRRRARDRAGPIKSAAPAVGVAVPDLSSPGTPSTMPGQQRWKIRCFGNLRVYRQDGSPIQWNRIPGATTKTKTLFALLLSRGTQGASAEETADLLWPDSPSMEQSLNRLYHTVHCLRSSLDPGCTASRGSPLLACREHRYYLTLPEGTWIDVPIFEEFCHRGERLLEAGQLEESLVCHQVAEKLYRGPLFADIPPKYAENDDNNWCWSRRYWLQQTHLKMLTYTAQIFRRLGNVDQAVLYGEQALGVDPCFEPAHRELMRSFHLACRPDALERQYRLCGEALRRYEARALSSETRLLYQELASRGESVVRGA
ncbi:MAG: MEDS domain-containing protein [Burkholderiaceae bacterium]|nr:MEDS domain-containing protein [Burkholderiaceae bacterium]